jgi:putative hemolysin
MKYSVIVVVIFMAACHTPTALATKGDATAPTQMANPASVKCINDGHRLEIRKSADGGEYGVCIDATGNECEEWKYFRGECTFKKQEAKKQRS